jgi:hypothetical protein
MRWNLIPSSVIGRFPANLKHRMHEFLFHGGREAAARREMMFDEDSVRGANAVDGRRAPLSFGRG